MGWHELKLSWRPLDTKKLKYKYKGFRKTFDYLSASDAITDMDKYLKPNSKLVYIVFSNEQNQWRLLYNFDYDSSYPG